MAESPAPQPAARLMSKSRSAPFKSSKPIKPATGWYPLPSGSGKVPIPEKIQWEVNQYKALQAYHLHDPSDRRRDKKTYLGMIGVKKQREIAMWTENEIIEFVEAFIAQKRSEKGITL